MENDRLMKLMNGEKPEAKKNRFVWLYIAVPLVFVAVYLYFNFDNPAYKVRAEQALDEYIAATYPTQLDDFEKGEGTVPYSKGNILGDKAVAYGYYYSKPEKGWGHVDIVADIDGNIVYDGYKEWYLTGGFNFERYRDEYYNAAYSLKQKLYAHGVNRDFFSGLDELGITQSMVCRIEGLEFGDRMIEPQLDPDNDYDINRLAREHGAMMVYLKSTRDSQEDFVEFASFAAEWLAGQDVYFNNVTFFLRPAKMEDVQSFQAVLTMDEIHSDNIEAIIKDRRVQYTQEQYKYDREKMLAGEEWTEEYSAEFQAQIQFELI